MSRKGFTLIELLIVVLIIAILAAIAVPNFLEFQTRAKVSRAKSDMRSMATAIEAYYVDNNSYPFSAIPVIHPALQPTNSAVYSSIQDSWRFYAQMTTPIAYMSTIPVDVFSPQVDGMLGNATQQPFYYMSGNAREYESSASYEMASRSVWVLVSVGPDRNITDHRSANNMLPASTEFELIDNTDADTFFLYDRTEINRGGSGCNGLPYDPTNGTVSIGDVFRINTADNLPLFQY